jgi:hypothetical protein
MRVYDDTLCACVCMHGVESTTTCRLLVCACTALTMHHVPCSRITRRGREGLGFGRGWLDLDCMTHMAACLGNLNAEVVSAVAVGEYVPRVSRWYVGVSKEVGRRDV